MTGTKWTRVQLALIVVWLAGHIAAWQGARAEAKQDTG